LVTYGSVLLIYCSVLFKNDCNVVTGLQCRNWIHVLSWSAQVTDVDTRSTFVTNTFNVFEIQKYFTLV